MLAPATVGNLPALRAMIRQGAKDGAFDRELATDSPEASLFFANLRQALITGYFVVQDANGALSPCPASGYVYFAENSREPREPIGFGTFRAFDAGFELWLTAVAPQWRGIGHGRCLLASLLATPAGRLAWIVRVRLRGASASIMERLLTRNDYAPVVSTRALRWYVRRDAPRELRERVVQTNRINADD